MVCTSLEFWAVFEGCTEDTVKQYIFFGALLPGFVMGWGGLLS